MSGQSLCTCDHNLQHLLSRFSQKGQQQPVDSCEFLYGRGRLHWGLFFFESKFSIFIQNMELSTATHHNHPHTPP
eukprot:NODE_661_length_684_cov_267.953321_g652_i0.p2 GENE.NODE_661_length_684_cov_267.953321_g652_i0~~NODE_661_length_684_cov_267.953321_g652_i0.p2  ORF type:complete len:75 (-),score=9.83 NODE_661_length_684_cov_267.953321_g652_i0:405-629(-)